MTKEKAEEIAWRLKKLHSDFNIKEENKSSIAGGFGEGQNYRVKALTDFLPMTSEHLRDLATIVEGHCLSIKRSGTKVNVSVW